MWELLLALFGGVSLTYRYLSDRSKTMSFDEKMDKAKLDRLSWSEWVEDYELEERTKALMMCWDRYRQMERDTLNLIRSFHGLERAKFNKNYDRKTKDYYVKQLVLYVELVKLGKLPRHELSAVPLYLCPAINLRVSKRAIIEFCKWVEQSLRDNGIPARLFYSQSCLTKPWIWEPYAQFSSDAIPLSSPDIEDKVYGISTHEAELINQAIIRR